MTLTMSHQGKVKREAQMRAKRVARTQERHTWVNSRGINWGAAGEDTAKDVGGQIIMRRTVTERVRAAGLKRKTGYYEQIMRPENDLSQPDCPSQAVAHALLS